MVKASARLCLVIAFAACACGVNAPPGSTGGTTVSAGQCGRGLVVVSSDYVTTNVSFIGFGGEVLSASVVSSGTTSTGLSAPLSGDVVLPTTPAQGDRIVLIDRYPAAVLTWVDVTSGSVAAQLDVRTGFFANPQDYLEASPSRAYVPRYGSNPSPGTVAFDEGNDLLVVDPAAKAIQDRIDLKPAMAGEVASYLPSAGRALHAGRYAYVALDGYSVDFNGAANARIVTLDPQSGRILRVTLLDGAFNCRGLALSPDGKEIALSCSGLLSPPHLDQSWLMFMTAEEAPLEIARHPASAFGAQPLGFSVGYASATTVLLTSFGTFPDGSSGDDEVIELDRTTGTHRVVLRSARSPSCGQSELCPFSIGDVACAAACGVCFVADAVSSGGVVHRFAVGPDGHLTEPTPIVVEREIGLPPRYLQLF